MSKELLLEVKNLNVSVEEKHILHDVNLEIGRHETHVLMGPNGTGKSTLGYTLVGNPRYQVESGEIFFSKHFMDIMNGSYAQTHFPCKLWDAGEKGLTLSAFEWEKDRKTLIYGQVDYMYGEALYKPEMKEGNPIRLYSLDEITEIFGKLGLRICNSFADFSGKPSSDNDIQLMVYSIRE